MANWEYKVLSSGKHGMATMAALEQHLNDLGQQQWEIINWHTAPDNPLLFTGLARRPILRDWKPEEMPSAQAAAREKAEEEKERSAWRDTLKEELEFVTERENEIEDDPVADTEDLLDMLVPMMRRSQRGQGSLGAISFLARKLNQSDDDLLGALAEAGLTIEEDPNAVPPSVEHDGDYFWLNRNQRGEPWLNSGPKPPLARAKGEARSVRPVRDESAGEESESAEAEANASEAPDTGNAPASAEAASGETPRPPAREPREPREGRHSRDQRGGRDRPDSREGRGDRHEQGGGRDDGSAKPLPEGEALLDRLRPMMRRNRRGRGLSGSISYLSRALRHSDADLSGALAKLGLVLPAEPQGKPVFVEIGNLLYWLNLGQGGQIWINTREKRAGETAESAHADEDVAPSSPSAESGGANGAPAETAPAGEVTPSNEPLSAPTTGEPEAAAETSPVSGDAESASSRSAGAAPSQHGVFSRIRPHFSRNKRGASFSAAPGAVAEALGISQADLVESLVKAGLEVPDNEDSKPVFAEHDGEVFWFNRNAKDELWLNAKPKPARKGRGGARAGGARKDGDDEEAPE